MMQGEPLGLTVLGELYQAGRGVVRGAAVDPSMLGAYRRAMKRRGVAIVMRRVSGDAPNASTFDAPVIVILTAYQPEQDVMAVKPEGGISQGLRSVIVLQDDLQDQRFPLPVQKNDKVVLDTGEVLNVTEVDPYKRALASAIELKVEGV
jgi:hypothetical protein